MEFEVMIAVVASEVVAKIATVVAVCYWSHETANVGPRDVFPLKDWEAHVGAACGLHLLWFLMTQLYASAMSDCGMSALMKWWHLAALALPIAAYALMNAVGYAMALADTDRMFARTDVCMNVCEEVYGKGYMSDESCYKPWHWAWKEKFCGWCMDFSVGGSMPTRMAWATTWVVLVLMFASDVTFWFAARG